MKMATFLCITIIAFAISMPGQTPAPKQVHEKGCVRLGVEAGCLVAVTFDGKTTYELQIAKNPPKPGDVIEFWGTEVQGMSICMQGKQLKVTKWTRLKMPCPLPGSDK